MGKNATTYLDLNFSKGTKLGNFLFLHFDAQELSDALHVLLELNDEARDHGRYIVPLMGRVLDLAVNERVLDLLPLQSEHQRVVVGPLLGVSGPIPFRGVRVTVYHSCFIFLPLLL